MAWFRVATRASHSAAYSLASTGDFCYASPIERAFDRCGGSRDRVQVDLGGERGHGNSLAQFGWGAIEAARGRLFPFAEAASRRIGGGCSKERGVCGGGVGGEEGVEQVEWISALALGGTDETGEQGEGLGAMISA